MLKGFTACTQSDKITRENVIKQAAYFVQVVNH